MFLTLKASLISLAATPSGEILGAEHHETGGAFPPFDPAYFSTQIFWLVLTFAALYLILSKVFLPKIGETLEERSSRIADDLDSAALMQRDAEEAKKSYEQSLADARAKAHNVSETTRQAIDAEVTAELDAADAEAAKQADQAEARIRDIRAAGMAKVETIAADVAQEIVQKMLGKAPTAAALKKALG